MQRVVTTAAALGVTTVH